MLWIKLHGTCGVLDVLVDMFDRLHGILGHVSPKVSHVDSDEGVPFSVVKDAAEREVGGCRRALINVVDSARVRRAEALWVTVLTTDPTLRVSRDCRSRLKDRRRTTGTFTPLASPLAPPLAQPFGQAAGCALPPPFGTCCWPLPLFPLPPVPPPLNIDHMTLSACAHAFCSASCGCSSSVCAGSALGPPASSSLFPWIAPKSPLGFSDLLYCELVESGLTKL